MVDQAIMVRPENICNFQSAAYAVDETASVVNVVLQRTNFAPGSNLDIEVQTLDITAIANTHYIPIFPSAPGFFTFLNGASTLTIPISILNAGLGSGNSRTFSIRIHSFPQGNGTIGGQINIATITINGISSPSTGGSLSFSGSSFSLPEDAGTDSSTITINRTGASGSPAAASISVAAQSGSAVAGTDFVNDFPKTVNWPSGDTAQKAVPFTPIDNPAFTGSKTLTLSLSSPTGALLGTPASSSIIILDTQTPPTGVWPKFAADRVGTSKGATFFTTQTFINGCAPNDFVIIPFVPSVSVSTYTSGVAAIKSAWPGIKVGIYHNPLFAKQGLSFFATHDAHVAAQHAVPGLSVSPNTWLCQRSDGVQVTSANGDKFGYRPNNCVRDANGLNYITFLMKYLIDRVHSVVGADIFHFDNFGAKAGQALGSFVWLSNNVDTSINDPAQSQAVRDSWINAGVWLRANTNFLWQNNSSSWAIDIISGDVPASAVDDFRAIGVDGGIFEQWFGKSNSPGGQYPSGSSIINNGFPWSLGKNRFTHAVFANSQYRTNPPMNIALCNAMLRTNLNGAGKTAGYKYARYVMTTVWCVTDGNVDLCPGEPGSQYADFDDYDEMSGFGPSTPAQRYANKGWMGLALNPAQSSGVDQGVFRREFQNAIIWCNPLENGTKTCTVPSAGSGKKWTLIPGAQDPSVNTGADVSGTIVVPAGDGRILKRVSV